MLTKILIILNNKKLKIYFADFWPNFKFDDNYFYNLLKSKYELKISEHNPDLLIHSFDYSGNAEFTNFKNKNTQKIFYTGENVEPDFNKTDYSISFHENTERNYRLPLWALYIDWFSTKKDKNRDPSFLIPVEKLTKRKKYNFINKPLFCSFIASKPTGKRLEFVPKLNERKKVYSLGRLYSNSFLRAFGRGDQKTKLNLMRMFKFNIAFENEISDGYVTEKLLHALYTDSIPIYWGTKKVKEDFNERGFLFYDDFKDEGELLNKIIEISQNKQEINKYLNEPIFQNDKIPEFCKPSNVLNFITEKIES